MRSTTAKRPFARLHLGALNRHEYGFHGKKMIGTQLLRNLIFFSKFAKMVKQSQQVTYIKTIGTREKKKCFS